MKHAPTIAGVLLGLLFVIFGLNFFLKFITMPPGPPEGSPPALFMGALFATGYLAFVKVLEILGGVLVAVPKTRNIGLLILGPIIVNILCFHVFLTKGATLVDPVNIGITLLGLFLLWTERKAFEGLLLRTT
jgi:putative oxidoreductase